MNLAALLGHGSDARMYVRSLFSAPFGTLKEREIVIDGIRVTVRRRSSDLFVVREIFKRTVYSTPPKGIVIDLGANIGAYSLYAARSATKVYAFEPESSNFEQLKKNIELNRALPIHIFKKAASGTNGTAQLSLGAINKGASSLVLKRSDAQEQVETLTLDHILSLCGLSHVDFLKIDIEGSEYELFENASIHTLRRISTIVMETHRVKGKSLRDIIVKLESAGFRVRSTYTRFLFGMRMLHAHRDA